MTFLDELMEKFYRESEPDLDLGLEHYGWKTCWEPDRELNPQFADLADVEWLGLTIGHRNGVTGEPCHGHVSFKQDNRLDELMGSHVWDVHSYDPLHIEPSVLCKMPTGDKTCGDHGWIRGGRWEAA